MPQPDHVVRVALPDPSDWDDDLKAYFAKCDEKLGMRPNVLLAYTARPDKFRAFTRFYNQLMLAEDSGLSKLEREMIAVVVSSANRCYYCLVAHGQAVRELSGDPQLGEMLAFNYRVAELSERRRRMLDFAWKLTTAPHDVDGADREGLHQPHGARARHDAQPGIPRQKPRGGGGVKHWTVWCALRYASFRKILRRRMKI